MDLAAFPPTPQHRLPILEVGRYQGWILQAQKRKMTVPGCLRCDGKD